MLEVVLPRLLFVAVFLVAFPFEIVNTNGLLRQYFPKGTDLSVYPEDYLDAVAEELNDRPRKTLGFMKPSEKIIELLDAA